MSGGAGRRLLAGVGRRRALAAACAAGAAVAVLLAVLATRSVAPGSAAATALGGKPAPAISGRSVTSGKAVTLAALHGRYVVVTFFASWCQPCQQEVPALAAFLWSHRDATGAGRVAVLGVVFQDSAANARSFLDGAGATWPAVTDPSGSIAYAYGVADPPQSFLVGPDGDVVGHYDGELTEHYLEDWVGAAQAVQ
ncbi:MAG TPA: TlpA disulfide reductase family protein [Acidimicrobiales bacterium]|nr:TlpA disulfide reductase family protein [Acidimicrobiales bacterium]